jgi:hypothetical protein
MSGSRAHLTAPAVRFSVRRPFCWARPPKSKYLFYTHCPPPGCAQPLVSGQPVHQPSYQGSRVRAKNEGLAVIHGRG